MMKRSFTVTELLVVIAIIVILSGILIGGVGYAGRRADEAKTIAAIQQLSAAFEAFRDENGFFPPSHQYAEQDVKFYRPTSGELYIVLGNFEYKFVDKQGKPFFQVNDLAATATSKGKAEPYVDVWGKPFRYRCPGNHNKNAFDLRSYGAGQTDGGNDDIANWVNASQQ